MTENALSILILIFSAQLQQTETSDRKLFIFHLGPGPAEVDGKVRVIGPTPPRSSKVTESMYKYLQKHIEVLKLCIIKSANK